MAAEPPFGNKSFINSLQPYHGIASEEIDISILNDSEDPRLRRESAILLAECRNWIGKCAA